MDVLNRTFTVSEVAQAAGLKQARVTDWCNRGLVLGLEEAAVGRGRGREFDWPALMEVAVAGALMAAGVNSPADAFRAAQKFAHTGHGPSGWVGEPSGAKVRHPGFPYRDTGDTFLFVAGDRCAVDLVRGGAVDLGVMMVRLGSPAIIAVNVSAIFGLVAVRLGLDAGKILDQAYGTA